MKKHPKDIIGNVAGVFCYFNYGGEKLKKFHQNKIKSYLTFLTIKKWWNQHYGMMRILFVCLLFVIVMIIKFLIFKNEKNNNKNECVGAEQQQQQP